MSVALQPKSHVSYVRIDKVSDVIDALQREGFAKVASRAALLPWPGFSDHFPYGYVKALREELELHQYSE